MKVFLHKKNKTADSVKSIEEILNGELHFVCCGTKTYDRAFAVPVNDA